MISSYDDIRSKVENLFRTEPAPSFIAICEAALGGKRGLSRFVITKTVASNSIDQIHEVLRPYVNEVIRENQEKSDEAQSQYEVLPLGNNEFRLKKTKDKDIYKRAPEDYIVNLNTNSCTCPEFLNRLEKIFIPCKHLYLLDKRLKASSSFQLIKFADTLDSKGLYEEANQIDMLAKIALLTTKPVRLFHHDDVDGIFSALMFRDYSGTKVISTTPVSPGFDLEKDDKVYTVVLDTYSKSGAEDYRIDHHATGTPKDSDVVNTGALSCAGLVASVVGAPVDAKVLVELDALDSGKATYFDWSNVENRLSLSMLPKGVVEDWGKFEEAISAVAPKLEKDKYRLPGLIEEIGQARIFGSWEMSGEETDKYITYFVNFEYPQGVPFTVIGRMYSDKRPEAPYQIFIANSPTRKDIDIGSLISRLKKELNFENGGGRSVVGGCNFDNKEKAEQVFQQILGAVK